MWRAAFTAIVVVAFVTYQLKIKENVATLGEDALDVYGAATIVVTILLAIGLVRAVAGVRFASRNIRNFEQPYQSLRAAERERYEQAVAEWETAIRRHAAEQADAARLAAERAAGPRWFPVIARSEPTRIDILGGDPRRNGWASLLVTLGTSVLATGNRITVLDLTGQDVGSGLLAVASARGLGSRRVEVADGVGLDLLAAAHDDDLAAVLGAALTARRDGDDRREERVHTTDVLRRVIDTVDHPLTFNRLAAAVRVLYKASDDGLLTSEEVSLLVTRHLGDIDQGDWTTRQLRLIASQLDALDEVAQPPAAPLWTDDVVSLIATAGGRGDRKELVDRVVVQLAQRAMDTGALRGVVVLAGVDHLGPATLHALSDHARRADVRLVLMIDQLHGAIESVAGTGGAVCLMKMYNHRDANAAAEFIGRGHRFVISQVSRQVGNSFTDTGGDSFAANTGETVNYRQRRSGTRGRGSGLSDARGHTWTATRSWSSSDSISTTDSSSRVYEFIVEPQELLGMPETSFILVDNTGPGRRVVMADGNPGICLLDGIAMTPA